MTIPILNFVSGIATPPVNELLAAVAARSDLSLRIWYAEEADPKLYPWRENPTHEVRRAEIYGKRWPDPRLLRLAVSGQREGFMIAGWSNPTTRALIALLSLRRRRFAFFTDRPSHRERTWPRALARQASLRILGHSSTTFCIGKNAVDYFAQLGFSPDRLCNLPLPVGLSPKILSQAPDRETIRRRFSASPSDFFVVTGSRLVPSKGFDLLLTAIAQLEPEFRSRIKLLIVGSGPERDRLEDQIRSEEMQAIVRIEPWMEFSDFCGCIGAADVVIHPAREDAYGGITLTAVAMGVPTIGTRQSGSAMELIEDGRSGFLYDAADTAALTGYVRQLMQDKQRCASMAEATRQAAAKWTAERLAATLVTRLFTDGILGG
jgi:glycosyltransferase involved in cell wall biosynthesis